MQWAEEGPPPLLVKISPDLSKQDLDDIAMVYALFCFTICLFQFPAFILTCMFITSCNTILPSR